MSTRLTVRNSLNNKWLDQCSSEFYFRDGNNSSWVRFLPEQTSVRDSGNNDWLDVDCTFDPVLDDVCDNLALLSSVTCPTSISIEFAGSGNGQGSDGPEFDILTGYPIGYDLPDAGQVGFGSETAIGSFENVVITRPGLEFVKESYGSEGVNTFYGKGTYANPSYLYTHTMSNGSAVTETIYEIGQSSGIFEILYASYDTSGISIDVYYLGALIASTCGRVLDRGKLEFTLDSAIGAGEDRIMIRVRGVEDTRWLYNVHGPKAGIGLAAFEPGNISHLAAIRTTEYVGTPLFPAPSHARTYPFANRLPDGQYWYEYTHEIGLLDPAVGPHILHLNFETWDNQDWVEVYHGSKRIASTFKYLAEDGLLEIVFNAYRFTTPVPDIVVKVMAEQRTRDADIISQEYMIYDSNTQGYKENRWLCETPTDGISSAGHYSTEDHFQMNADQEEGVASVKIEGLNPETEYTASVFDLGGNLISAVQGKGTQFINWFKLNSSENYDLLDQISVRIDAPIDSGWNYEVGCYIPILDIQIDDQTVPACPSQDDVRIVIGDTVVAEGSQAVFHVSTNYPVREALTVSYATQDITASSQAGAEGSVNPYPLYRSSDAEITGAIYKDEDFNYSLLVEADTGRLYGPLANGTRWNNFFDKQTNVTQELSETNQSVNSFSALSPYYKMIVNMIQDRLGPLSSGHKMLVLSHQRIITQGGGYQQTDNGRDEEYEADFAYLMDTSMDHMVKSIKNIYGITVDVKYYNDFGVSHGRQVDIQNVTYSSHRTSLSNYDIIVSDAGNNWQHHREENTDVSTFADFENKVFVSERSSVFATELARTIKQSASPKVVILGAGSDNITTVSNRLRVGNANAKDVVNALGIKGSLNILSGNTTSSNSGDIALEIITDINGTSDFLFNNIDPYASIYNETNAKGFSKFDLSSVKNGVVGGSPGTTVDYQSKSGTVTIPAGASGAEILINTYSDTVSDSGEQFKVLLSNPSGGTISDDTGIATITEDDTGTSRNDIQISYEGNILGKATGQRGNTQTNYPDIVVGFVMNSTDPNMTFPSNGYQNEGKTVPNSSPGSIAVTFSNKVAENISDRPSAAGTITTDTLLGSFDFDPARTYQYKWVVTQLANTSTGYVLGDHVHNYTSYLAANASPPLHSGDIDEYGTNNTHMSIQFEQQYSSTSLDGTVRASVEIYVKDDTGHEQKSDPITVTLQIASTGTTATTYSTGGGCLATDTLIHYEDNTTKTAINLKAGDRIIGYTVPGMIDEATPGWENWTTTDVSEGREQVVTVRSAHLDWFREYYVINSDLRITKEHPLLVKTNDVWSWKDVRDIKVGDYLMGRHGHEVYVGTLKRVDDPIDVIVIDVEEIDTYFAGERAVLTHNAGATNKV